jgi:hypothetical protein
MMGTNIKHNINIIMHCVLPKLSTMAKQEKVSYTIIIIHAGLTYKFFNISTWLNSVSLN